MNSTLFDIDHVRAVAPGDVKPGDRVIDPSRFDGPGGPGRFAAAVMTEILVYGHAYVLRPEFKPVPLTVVMRDE